MRILALILITVACHAEVIANINGTDIQVRDWCDIATGQHYLIVTRDCDCADGSHAIAVAITPRLPPLVVTPDPLMSDTTYEYTITLTEWTPVNGWERVAVIDGNRSKYRRRLDYIRTHLEKP